MNNSDMMSRSGGLFWGFVFLIIGILIFLNAFEIVDITLEMILAVFLVIIGLWLVIAKSMR